MIYCEHCHEDGVSIEGAVLMERQPATIRATVTMGSNVQVDNVCGVHAASTTMFPRRYTKFENIKTGVRVTSDEFKRLGKKARLALEATEQEDRILAHIKRVEEQEKQDVVGEFAYAHEAVLC